MDAESSTKFIGSLTKFLQSLCNGYVEFDDGVELIGHIYLSVDAGKTGKTLNYFLNEKVCKNDNSVTFISNSFHAQPEGKSKPSGKDGENRKEDGDVSDSGDNIPKSTNAGTILSRPHVSSRSGSSPSQNRTGVHIGTKRPGSPLKGPTPQRRAPTPPSQRRFQSSASRGTVGSPVSKTVPSSPSSSSQDNIPSPSPARKNRNDIGQPTSNQSDNINADNENDIVSSNVLSINPTPEFASFLGSLTSDNQTSQDQSSPPDTKPDTDVTFIKEEFVSEPSSCAQAGSGGQHSGRSGEDNSGLYPVMLHQNTSVFPSTSAGFPSYQGGASATATSQQSGFPGTSSSQSDPFNPVPGTSQDGADPSGDEDVEAVFVASPEYRDVCCYVSSGGTAFSDPQNQQLRQTIHYVIADSDVHNNPCSSEDTEVSCEPPAMFSAVEHPTVTMSDLQANDVSGPNHGSSFSLPDPPISFSDAFQAEASVLYGNAMPVIKPEPRVDDTKYDLSHFLIWSHDQGALESVPFRRGPGRPRKSLSRVRPYDGRKPAQKLSAGKKQASPSVSIQRGTSRVSRARGSVNRGRGRGRQQSVPDFQNNAAVSFRGGISAALLGGAVRSHKTSPGRGKRGNKTEQRGRGFQSLKNFIAKKYSQKKVKPNSQGKQGGGTGHGGARRGAGRPRKSSAPPHHVSLMSALPGLVPDCETAIQSEVAREGGETSFQSNLSDMYTVQEKDAVQELTGRKGITIQRGNVSGRRGGIRRGVGRPRKVQGPLSLGRSTQLVPSTIQTMIDNVLPGPEKKESAFSLQSSQKRNLSEISTNEEDAMQILAESKQTPMAEISSSDLPETSGNPGEDAVQAQTRHERRRISLPRGCIAQRRGGMLRGKVRGLGQNRPAQIIPMPMKTESAVYGAAMEELELSSQSDPETSISGTFTAQEGDRAQTLALQKQTTSAKLPKHGYRGRGGMRPGAGRPRKSSVQSERGAMTHSVPVPSNVLDSDVSQSGEGKFKVGNTSSLFEEVNAARAARIAGRDTAVTLTAQGRRQMKNRLAGRSTRRGRISTLSGRGRGLFGVSAYSGRRAGRPVMMISRRGRGKRMAHFLPSSKAGGLLTLKNLGEEGGLLTGSSFRGRGRMIRRFGSRRGGFRAAGGRGLHSSGLDREEKADQIKTEDFVKVRKHKCAKCGKRYVFVTGLYRHRKRCEGRSSSFKDEDKTANDTAEEVKEDKRLECSTCGKRYVFGACLIRHRKSCERQGHSLQPFQDDKPDNDEAKDVAESKPFQCATCGKRYVFNACLVRHRRICEGQGHSVPPSEKDRSDHNETEDVTKKKPFQCATCGKRYVFNACLISHRKTCGGQDHLPHDSMENRSDNEGSGNETEDVPDHSWFECIMCSDVFYDLDQFKRHAKNQHVNNEDDIMLLLKKH